jgi:hypothetical protein
MLLLCIEVLYKDVNLQLCVFEIESMFEEG